MNEPTDAEILDLWESFVGEPTEEIPLSDSDKLCFARAALRSWGQPSGAGEPVALLVRKNSWRDGQWEAAPPNSPSYGLAWANQRVYVYTTPQPTQAQAGAVPLTVEQVNAILLEAGYGSYNAPVPERAAFISGLRHSERAHGIGETP